MRLDRRRTWSTAKASPDSRRAWATRLANSNDTCMAEVGAGPLAVARAPARADRSPVDRDDASCRSRRSRSASGSPASGSSTTPFVLVFDAAPTALRDQARKRNATATPGSLSFRLPFRKPFTPPTRCSAGSCPSGVPGVEEFRDGVYRRSMRLPNGNCIAELSPTPDYIACRLILDDVRDLTTAIARCRRLLDLDADPEAVDDALGTRPVPAPTRREAPGHRASVAARTSTKRRCASCSVNKCHSARLAPTPGVSWRECGPAIADPAGGLTHMFPSRRRARRLRRDAVADPRVTAAVVAWR